MSLSSGGEGRLKQSEKDNMTIIWKWVNKVFVIGTRVVVKRYRVPFEMERKHD